MKNYKQRLQYYFENTISQGPIGVIKWLALVSLFIVLCLGLVILIFGIKGTPDATEHLGFWEGSWKSLMATLDPGTMGGDDGWAFRTVRFIATLAGIFVISILIGSISSGIDAVIDNLKKGKSTILENNHTLILGWSEKIFTIVDEIVIANENQKKPCIVIMADRDKVEMEDELRAKISSTKNTKIIVRSGSILDPTDIKIVNPNGARSIIILYPDNVENGDIHTIKSVLSITNSKTRKAEPYHIVAEIRDETNMETAELVGNDEAVFILSSQLISKITAQTCRQSGLSVVYSELMQFDGDELYTSNDESNVGLSFKEVLFTYQTSSIIGVETKNEDVLINPAMNYILQEGDKVIAISEDDDTIIKNTNVNYQLQTNHIIHQDIEVDTFENTLILGWNANAENAIKELDNYVPKGSTITILHHCTQKEDCINNLANQLQNQIINYVVGDITKRKALDAIQPQNFNHIILLSDTDKINIQESDAQTLICLLHLRQIAELHNKDFSIVSEMLDIRNKELGEVTKADDFIVGDNLISMLMAQFSENKNLKKIFDILFDADGSEIYLKPVCRYIKSNEAINFYTIVESASQLSEVAIGYRIQSLAQNADKKFGVVINPNKNDMITFTENDYIILLAEN